LATTPRWGECSCKLNGCVSFQALSRIQAEVDGISTGTICTLLLGRPASPSDFQIVGIAVCGSSPPVMT
jgi:hypothetical protein